MRAPNVLLSESKVPLREYNRSPGAPNLPLCSPMFPSKESARPLWESFIPTQESFLTLQDLPSFCGNLSSMGRNRFPLCENQTSLTWNLVSRFWNLVSRSRSRPSLFSVRRKPVKTWSREPRLRRRRRRALPLIAAFLTHPGPCPKHSRGGPPGAHHLAPHLLRGANLALIQRTAPATTNQLSRVSLLGAH